MSRMLAMEQRVRVKVKEGDSSMRKVNRRWRAGRTRAGAGGEVPRYRGGTIVEDAATSEIPAHSSHCCSVEPRVTNVKIPVAGTAAENSHRVNARERFKLTQPNVIDRDQS